MISTSNFRDCATIHTNHVTDKDTVRRIATAALRHGSRVCIVLETRGKRTQLCTLRPLSGAIWLSSEKDNVSHPNPAAAVIAGLARFAETFDRLNG